MKKKYPEQFEDFKEEAKSVLEKYQEAKGLLDHGPLGSTRNKKACDNPHREMVAEIISGIAKLPQLNTPLDVQQNRKISAKDRESGVKLSSHDKQDIRDSVKDEVDSLKSLLTAYVAYGYIEIHSEHQQSFFGVGRALWNNSELSAILKGLPSFTDWYDWNIANNSAQGILETLKAIPAALEADGFAALLAEITGISSVDKSQTEAAIDKLKQWVVRENNRIIRNSASSASAAPTPTASASTDG